VSAQHDSYLFDLERPRFECLDEDVLVKAADLVLLPGGRLRSTLAAAELEISHVTAAIVERVLSAVDGQKTLAEIGAACGDSAPEARRIVQACFGVVIFAPQAVERLERALSGTEITRFPGSPYEIVRNYWRNMIAVRAECKGLERALVSAQGFRSFLSELNVIALRGADGETPYTPASPISRKGVAPGSFLESVPETRATPEGTLFVAGPRVNVKLIGGEFYHRVLYERAGDPGAADNEREIVLGGLAWGRVVRARAAADAEFGDWFCPPRPLELEHFERLRESLAAALEAANADAARDAVRACARFHWQFVRLHPFHSANQSLAMNLVNFVLARALGAGIPHLILDQLALRLDMGGYQAVFESAARGYALAGKGPVTRYRELRARKLRAYALIGKMGQAPSLERARAWADAEPENAGLALVIRER
jgi:hypothetical protein